TLCRAGFETWGFDVRDAAVQAFEEAGGHAASSPAALGRKVDVAIVLVATADQVRTVLFGEAGAAATMHEGSVVIASATVPASVAVETGFLLSEHHILMLDAPVSGGVVGAEAGTLSLMASGPDEAFDIAAGVLDAIGSKVYRLGDRHGVGSTVKTINQLLAGVHIAASAEAMALGVKAGVDPQTLYEVISNSAGSSWMFQNRVPHMLAGDYTPLSAVEIFVKDLGIVLATGQKERFPLPLAAAAHQLFLMAAAAGYGRLDDAAVVKVFEDLAGISVSVTTDKDKGGD